MGIHVLMNNTANFYNTYVTAVALDAISWKYYLVFVALNVVYGKQTFPKHRLEGQAND